MITTAMATVESAGPIVGVAGGRGRTCTLYRARNTLSLSSLSLSSDCASVDVREFAMQIYDSGFGFPNCGIDYSDTLYYRDVRL